MRTTLTIDDDVLDAAKYIAAIEHKTVGEIISRLARCGLQLKESKPAVRNGIQLLPVQPGDSPSTPELVR
jgi:hypothetical protein